MFLIDNQHSQLQSLRNKYLPWDLFNTDGLPSYMALQTGTLDTAIESVVTLTIYVPVIPIPGIGVVAYISFSFLV